MSAKRGFSNKWVNCINDVNIEVTLTTCMVPDTCVYGVFKELLFVYSRFMQTTTNKTTLPLKLISFFNNYFGSRKKPNMYPGIQQLPVKFPSLIPYVICLL